MEGLRDILVPVIDWGLRITGAVALVVTAGFLTWWWWLG